MDLGQRIKGLREKEKISREALAEKIGVSYWSLSKYETGDREPDIETLQKIANFFEVSLDYLTGRTLSPKNKKSNSVLSKDLLEYLEKSENLHVGGFPISEEQKKVFIDFLKSVYYRRNGEV